MCIERFLAELDFQIAHESLGKARVVVKLVAVKVLGPSVCVVDFFLNLMVSRHMSGPKF